MLSDQHRVGRALAHVCGVAGVMIGTDGILGSFFENYNRLFIYGGLTSFILSLLLLAFGTRLLRENAPRKWKGPWRS